MKKTSLALATLFVSYSVLALSPPDASNVLSNFPMPKILGNIKIVPFEIKSKFDIRIPNSLPNAKSIGVVGDLKQDSFIPLEAEGGIWKGSGYIACDDSENGARISNCSDNKASPDPKQIIEPAAGNVKLEWKAGISDVYEYCFVKLLKAAPTAQAQDCSKKVEFSAMILHLSYLDLFLDSSSIKLKVENNSNAGLRFGTSTVGGSHYFDINLQFKCAVINNLGVSADCSGFDGDKNLPDDISLDLEDADKRDFIIVGYISSLVSSSNNDPGLMPLGDYIANGVSLDIVLG